MKPTLVAFLCFLVSGISGQQLLNLPSSILNQYTTIANTTESKTKVELISKLAKDIASYSIDERLRLEEEGLGIAKSEGMVKEELNFLISLTLNYARASKFELSKQRAEEAITRARMFQNKAEEYRAARAWANSYAVVDAKEANQFIRPFWEQIEKETADSLQRTKGLYYNTLTMINTMLGKYDDAYQFGLNGLELSRRLKVKEFELEFLSQLANVLNIQGDFKQALSYSLPENGLRNENDPSFGSSCINLASIYSSLDSLDQAIRYSKKALAVKNIHFANKLSAYLILAQALVKAGRSKEAIKTIAEAEREQPKDRFTANQAELLIVKGRALTELKDCAAAIAVFEKAKSYYDTLQGKTYEWNKAKLEANYFKAKLCLEGKDTLLKEYTEITNTSGQMHTEMLNAKVQTLQVQYETAQKERQILEQQTELRQKSLYQWIYGLIALLAAAAALGFYKSNQDRKKEANQLQREMSLQRELFEQKNAALVTALEGVNLQSLTPEGKAAPVLHEAMENQPLEISNGRLLLLKDIISINADENITEFISTHGSYKDTKSIGFWTETLEPTGIFLRTHRSHLVNMQQVSQRISYKELKLTSGEPVPIGRTYKSKVDAWLATHALGT